MTGLVTLATPDRGSVQVKVTVTGPKLPPKMSGGGLRWPVMVGLARSMLMLPTVAEAVFPAMSVQVPITDCPAPSADTVEELEYDATPDRPSVHAKLTVTATLFQPLAFAEGDLEPVMVGSVLSMLILETVAEALFPARSVTNPVTDCPKPSLDGLVGGLQKATPERESKQVKLTVALLLTHPLAFGEGEREPVMVGEVRSMLILVAVVLAELPALSVQLPVTD